MDLNGDGTIDVLSGSYSRKSEDMAGLFQVLFGRKGGGFGRPQPLDGSDGEPLILPKQKNDQGDDGILDAICTRPTAVDLDGDGKLDLVAGNFRGTFGFFRGGGDGDFDPKAEWLQADGKPLSVGGHGDPFFVDHDGDGDLDLWSGSEMGGVYLFENLGSKTAPKWGKRTTVCQPPRVQRVGESPRAPEFGDAHLRGPQRSTRVWLADVDGDGKLDLLVGDTLALVQAAPGVDEASARTQYAAWARRWNDLSSQPEPESRADQRKRLAEFEALENDRKQFTKDESTGFVWLFRGK